MIKFNRRQMNAIASMFDKIATASAVGVIIGTFVESKVSIVDSLLLVAVAVIFAFIGILLRSGDD
jgi:hypothetical protein